MVKLFKFHCGLLCSAGILFIVEIALTFSLFLFIHLIYYDQQGPPSAIKRELNNTPVETSYDILLQQQQLFLQCQLELKQKVSC